MELDISTTGEVSFVVPSVLVPRYGGDICAEPFNYQHTGEDPRFHRSLRPARKKPERPCPIVQFLRLVCSAKYSCFLETCFNGQKRKKNSLSQKQPVAAELALTETYQKTWNKVVFCSQD